MSAVLCYGVFVLPTREKKNVCAIMFEGFRVVIVLFRHVSSTVPGPALVVVMQNSHLFCMCGGFDLQVCKLCLLLPACRSY